MRTSSGVLAALTALLAASPNARPEETPAAAPSAEVAPAAPPTRDPASEPETTPQQPAPPGQWAYTQQYGWIWMPYDERYTWYPPDGHGSPYVFVYGPAFGWTWVIAPWVWGRGPRPCFGVLGPWPFAWYGWGWRSPRPWQFPPPHRDYPFPVYRGTPLPDARPAPGPARPDGVRPSPAPPEAPSRDGGAERG